MNIARQTLVDALNDPGVGGAGVIDMIDEALDNGDTVIVEEPDGSQSRLERDGNGAYVTTPIGNP